MSNSKKLEVTLDHNVRDAEVTIDGDKVGLLTSLAIFLDACAPRGRAVIQQLKHEEGRRVGPIVQHRLRLTNVRITADAVPTEEPVQVGHLSDPETKRRLVKERVDQARRWLEFDEEVTQADTLQAKLSALRLEPEEVVIVTVPICPKSQMERITERLRCIFGLDRRCIVVTEGTKFATLEVGLDLSKAREAQPPRETPLDEEPDGA